MHDEVRQIRDERARLELAKQYPKILWTRRRQSQQMSLLLLLTLSPTLRGEESERLLVTLALKISTSVRRHEPGCWPGLRVYLTKRCLRPYGLVVSSQT